MNIRSKTGSAIVELIIIFPFLLAVLFYFWDTMMEIISLQRIQAALIQLTVEPFDPPLQIINDLDEGIAKVELREDEIATQWLNSLADDLKYVLKNSGTGAEYTEFGVMLEMYAAEIKTIDDGELLPAGYPTRIIRNGDRHIVGTNNPKECWSEGDKKRFDAYRDKQVNTVLKAYDKKLPRFGRKVFKALVPWLEQNMEPYQAYKVFIVMMFCAKPPRVFSKSGVYDFVTFMPPKDVGMPS